jgi:hypothetical protein
MAEQKSVLSSVIDTVKEAVTNVTEAIKENIAPPAIEKPENPIVYMTNQETGYEKYYVTPTVLTELEKKLSGEPPLEMEKLAEKKTKEEKTKEAMTNVLTEIHSTDQPQEQTKVNPKITTLVNESTQTAPQRIPVERKEVEKKEFEMKPIAVPVQDKPKSQQSLTTTTPTSTVSTSTETMPSTTVTPSLLTKPITETKITKPFTPTSTTATKGTTTTGMATTGTTTTGTGTTATTDKSTTSLTSKLIPPTTSQNLKQCNLECQKTKVNNSLKKCQQILNDLTKGKETLNKAAITVTDESQYNNFNKAYDSKISQVQGLTSKLIPIESRLAQGDLNDNDKRDVELFDLQIEELRKSSSEIFHDIEHYREQPKTPAPLKIDLSKTETAVKPADQKETRLIEREQNVIEAENIALDKNKQQVVVAQSPVEKSPIEKSPIEKSPVEQSPVEAAEPKIPYFDEKAPYARDLKQKAVELGFEVEQTKDLDELIKETQAKM